MITEKMFERLRASIDRCIEAITLAAIVSVWPKYWCEGCGALASRRPEGVSTIPYPVLYCERCAGDKPMTLLFNAKIAERLNALARGE